MASLQPDRLVIAVEPIIANVRAISKLRNTLPNVHVVHGGLGDTASVGAYPAALDLAQAGDNTQISQAQYTRLARGSAAGEGRGGEQKKALSFFNITTVDELLDTLDVRLALAHWDVEGAELGVLQGAQRTIRRDEPIFIVESLPSSKPDAHERLMRFVRKELGYEAFAIPEICGSPVDCRNFVCVPRGPRLHQFEKHHKLVLESFRPIVP